MEAKSTCYKIWRANIMTSTRIGHKQVNLLKPNSRPCEFINHQTGSGLQTILIGIHYITCLKIDFD